MLDALREARSLVVKTRLHFLGTALEKLTKSVFLFDPTWVATKAPEESGTLPVVFLQVTKEECLQNNSVSKRRIILFEPEDEENEEKSYRPSVVHVVSDNVVVDPFKHKLECLLPANAFFKSLSNTATNINTASGFLGSNSDSEIVNALSILSAVFGGFISLGNFLDSAGAMQSDTNRKSLVSMARRRAILRYKSWASWDIKNVVISSLSVTKVGTEDDYFRAIVELQEMPVLFVGGFEDKGKEEPLTGLRVSAYNSVKSVFEKITVGADRRIL